MLMEYWTVSTIKRSILLLITYPWISSSDEFKLIANWKNCEIEKTNCFFFVIMDLWNFSMSIPNEDITDSSL